MKVEVKLLWCNYIWQFFFWMTGFFCGCRPNLNLSKSKIGSRVTLEKHVLILKLLIAITILTLTSMEHRLKILPPPNINLSKNEFGNAGHF